MSGLFVSGSCLGCVWVESGLCLGRVWVASGSRLGRVWVESGVVPGLCLGCVRLLCKTSLRGAWSFLWAWPQLFWMIWMSLAFLSRGEGL